jgi:hypothetical protein
MTTTTPSAIADTRSIPERVATLREIAERDPLAARDAAWAWFERLGALTRRDREGGSEQLAELFACGRASSGLDGPTQGILVVPLIHPIFDAFASKLTALWMPWLGKSFYASDARGDNRLTRSTRWVAKLLWPGYATRPGDGERRAFDFLTRIERGGIEPAVDVLVIDYEPVEENPDLIIRRIRDELVEIAADAHLGRILYRTDQGYKNIGYFALRVG